jgi:hypothetical protein
MKNVTFEPESVTKSTNIKCFVTIEALVASRYRPHRRDGVLPSSHYLTLSSVVTVVDVSSRRRVYH